MLDLGAERMNHLVRQGAWPRKPQELANLCWAMATCRQAQPLFLAAAEVFGEVKHRCNAQDGAPNVVPPR